MSNLPHAWKHLYQPRAHRNRCICKTVCNSKSKVGVGFGKPIQDFDGAARPHCGFEGPIWCQQNIDVSWLHVFAKPHVCFGGHTSDSFPRKDETTKLQTHFRKVEAEQDTQSRQSRPLPKNPASHVRPWHSVATASAVPGAPRQWWSKTSWRSYFLRSSLAQPHGYQCESFFMATHSSFDFLGYIGSGWGQSWNPRRRLPKILLRLLRKRSLPRRAQVNRDREMTLRKKSQLRHPLRQGWARGNPLSPRLRQSQAAKESELFCFSSTYCHLEIPEYNCCNVLYCSVSLSLRVATAAFWLYLLHRSCSPIRGPIVKIIFGENLQVTMCPCSSLDRVAAWEKWENLIKSEFLALVVPIHIYIYPSISPHRELPTASSLWVPDHFPNAGPKTSASKAPGNKPGPAARALAHAASQGVGVRENGSHHFGLRIFGKNNG